MSDPRNARENDAPPPRLERSRLAERPARREGERVSVLLLMICGCLIILGGAGILAWQLTSHTNASGVPPGTPTNGSPSAKQPAGCTAAREPVDLIKQQTARGLHLTVAQVQARVLAGKTIAQIATEQGLTPTQLRNLEVQALHDANNRWLSLGCSTQQDVQSNLQRDIGSPTYMDVEFTDWFGGHL